MATLSTHTLDGTDGTHARGIEVSLVRISHDGSHATILSGTTDDGGRFSAEIEPKNVDESSRYELVFNTGGYWAPKAVGNSVGIVEEIVVRISMPDANARYHIPVILSPNTYSVWWSGLA